MLLKTIIYFILISIFLSIVFSLYIPYYLLVKINVVLVMVFLMISLKHFSFYSNKEDRGIILNMWKMYFPIIMLMWVFIFSMDSSSNQLRIDYLKTTLNYELKTNEGNANETYQTYSRLVKSIIDDNTKKYISEKKEFSFNKYVDEEDFTIWYGNISFSVMNILTLFMLLWFIKEFKDDDYRKYDNNKLKGKFLKLKK